MFENMINRLKVNSVRQMINDDDICRMFDDITKDYSAPEGEKISLVATKRLICGQHRVVFSICSVRGMEITEIFKQFSLDDIFDYVEKNGLKLH